MEQAINIMNSIVWGIPVLALIVISGIYLTVSSRFAQFRLLPFAIRRFIHSIKSTSQNIDGITGYRALCTALAATVGTGNIAGVAGAIALGGPGTIFWMWICAILGMITKMAEVTIALKYRVRNLKGEYVGGPMYSIQSGLKHKYIIFAYIYAFFGIIAAFGVGNATQVNTVIEGIKSIASTNNQELDNCVLLTICIVIIILLTMSFKNGAKGVGSWAERLVPAASIVYIVLCTISLLVCYNRIPYAFHAIIVGAVCPKSVSCGVLGSAFLTLRIGVSRGVFTNEAGMGTASIAHASADVEQPVEQGLMGIIEVFLDTIVICTLTALVILCSNVTIPYGTDPGITLTMDAFSSVLGNWCRFLITGLACVFSFATILGWSVYGMRCAQFLFGESIDKFYVWCQSFAVLLGGCLNTSMVWTLSEIVNGLMAIPNLIALLFLSRVFLSAIKNYPNTKNAYRP